MKKDEWKEYVNHSAVSRKLAGDRGCIKSDYLDDPKRRKYRPVIDKLKNAINKWLSEL